MPKSDSQATTDPSTPTTSEMDAMWLALREEESRTADLASYELMRRLVAQSYGEAS
jgi:hypothetical protein